MKDVVRIAHLSDLHCDASNEWRDSFVNILNCLVEINPHVIFVTGDLVNHPTKKNYEALKSNFKEIREDRRLREDPYLTVVPGNHDFFAFGNRVFNFWKKKGLFNGYLKHFLYPCDNYDGAITSLLIKYKLAVFPLDSNRSTVKFASAEGAIRSPMKVMQSCDNLFRKICHDEGIDYNQTKKIALLHHHPIPIATAHKEEVIERFLTLRNSYHFLRACRSFNIDMVLHGHKHMSNLSNSIYFNGEEIQTITVSSCDTSGEYSAKEKEIKLIEIQPSGSVNIERYVQGQHESDFNKTGRKSAPSTYYGDVRKKRNQDLPVTLNVSECPVSNIKNKTKIITINEHGMAYVSISLSHIKWREDAGFSQKCIKERIRADLGRVSGGIYEFCQCPISGEVEERKWLNPDLVEGVHPHPEKPEAFDKIFLPANPIGGKGTDCFTLEYYLSSGYSLATWEHEERYKDWNPDRPKQEVASISVNYPTDFLELIVRFPPDFFPPVKGVYLEANEKEDVEELPSLDLLYGNAKQDKQETNFLDLKSAVRIRPELNEIAVIIKYPQPHHEYSLRWALPEFDYRLINESKNCERLCKKLINFIKHAGNDTKVSQLYRELQSFLEKDVFPDNNISVFLLLYDFEEKRLGVIRCPERFQQKINSHIIVGRGPAGLAFKRREAMFWEVDGRGAPHDSIPIYPVEEVIKDYRPVKVFAVPLCYPSFISPEDGQIGDELSYICPAWGCLSITSDNENSFHQLSSFVDDERKGHELIKLYRKINVWLRENLIKHFPEISMS